MGPQNNTTKWTNNLTEDISTNPVVGPDSTIYLGTYDYTTEQGNFYAFNANGTVKWNYTITDGDWNEISSTPAISSEGHIFFGTNFDNEELTEEHGNLYALSDTGTYLWNFTLPGTTSGIHSSPAIGSDGTVYFLAYIADELNNHIGSLFALTKDGALKWNYTLGFARDDYYHSPVIGDNGTIYVGFNTLNTGTVCALTDNVTQAILKWSYPVSGSNYVSSIVDSPSIGSDGTIYFGTNIRERFDDFGNGVFIALTDAGDQYIEKWCYRLFDGELPSWITSSPAIAKDGNIYFGYHMIEFMDGAMHFLGLMAITDNITQAEYQWEFGTDDVIVHAPSIGSDGTVYFGDDNSPTTFYALNSNGTEKWSLESSPVTTAAISKVGTLYFGSYDRPDGSCGPVLYAIQGPPSSLYIKTSADKTNPNVGDTVTITYYVGNNGPNTAYSTVLRFPIPAGMQFVKAWTSYSIGNITYDPTTNTVIWDLGDLPIIDPDGWVQLIAQAAGEIIISPLISTLTDNPNLSGNIQTAIINVHAATSTTTTANAATSNTVGMQNTGLPIVMLIFAFTMVLGGALVPKKKK